MKSHWMILSKTNGPKTNADFHFKVDIIVIVYYGFLFFNNFKAQPYFYCTLTGGVL